MLCFKNRWINFFIKESLSKFAILFLFAAVQFSALLPLYSKIPKPEMMKDIVFDFQEKMYSMQMNRIFALSLIILCLWTSCKRADDEPLYPPTPISRLYISFSDIANSDTQVYQNVVVFDPADSTDYFPTGNGYNTSPNQGMGITFSPDLRQVFQVSRLDYSVRYLTVSETGAVSTSSRSFVDSVRARSFRSIRYNKLSDQLFITNDDPATPANASLNIYNNPSRLVGQQNPRKNIRLTRRPWGIAMTGTKTDTDSLLLLSTLTAGEVWAFNLAGISTGDSVSTGTPNHRLTISGANDLRGIAYAPNSDILFLTDLGATTGTATDGKIYVIENARQTIRSGGSITPSRIITGSNTNLADPIDIAVSDDSTRKQYIYVADRANKTVMRFNFDANGNVSPNKNTVTRLSLTPEFIYLDAR